MAAGTGAGRDGVTPAGSSGSRRYLPTPEGASGKVLGVAGRDMKPALRDRDALNSRGLSVCSASPWVARKSSVWKEARKMEVAGS